MDAGDATGSLGVGVSSRRPGSEIRVLVVDDDDALADVTGTFVEDVNPAITTAVETDVGDALDRLADEPFDAVVSDFDMPGRNGLEFLEGVREEHPDLPFVLFTGKGSEEIASRAISAGVTDYLQKGTGDEQYELLANRITNAVAQTRARREYREAQARFLALTENAPFAVVTVDADSTVRYSNESIRDVLGYEPEDVVGEPLVALMPQRFRAPHSAGVERYLTTGERNLDWSWIELPGLHADGHEVPLGITFGELERDGEHLFTGIIRDISEQKYVEAERELLHETIRSTAEAETFRDGLDAVVRDVCDRFDWTYGEAWVPTADGDHLERTDAAYAAGDGVDRFAAVSAETTFEPGEGLPGRAWGSGESVWMPNVSTLTEAEFLRVEAAAAAGLKAAFGVPIFAGDEIVAVLAFYMVEERGEDDRLVEIVTTVATELGELMERRQKTDALHRRERDLARQRDVLARLNRLNTLIRTVVEATIEADTREEIEEMVCERMVADDPFVFAWVGTVDGDGEHVRPSNWAGGDGSYLEDVTITADDGPTGRGPTGRAVDRREVVVTQRIAADESYEPWREAALERGFASSAAIPILDGDRLYGVLNVYADRALAFGERERAVLGELGRAVGRTIGAIEQREALMSDRAVELELRSAYLGERLREATDESSVAVTVERVVPTSGRTFWFLSASGLSGETLVDVADRVERITDATVLESGDDWCRAKLALEGRTLAGVLADYGGRIRAMRYEDGEFRIDAEVPYDADVREVFAATTSVFPDLELVAQETIERRERSVEEVHAVFEGRITDRQHAALELAYFSGFFEWPRETSGEEVAESMGIAPATFHQHLRAGERTLFEEFFEG